MRYMDRAAPLPYQRILAPPANHLGVELDLIAEYRQNQHVTYDFGLAHLFTGQYLIATTHGKNLVCVRDFRFLRNKRLTLQGTARSACDD